MPLTGFNHTARPKYVVVLVPSDHSAPKVVGSFITEKTAINWAQQQNTLAFFGMTEGTVRVDIVPLDGPGETARGRWHTSEAHRTAAIEAQKGAA